MKSRNTLAHMTLTAVYEPAEDGWIHAYIREMPGVITAAPTLEEAQVWLADALQEYLLALSEGNGTTTTETVPGQTTRPLMLTVEAA